MQSDNAAKYLIPPSVSVVGMAYTGNGSYAAAIGHLGFFNEGKIRYSGGAIYSDIDLDYYNLGAIDLTRPLSISTKGYSIFQAIKFKTGGLLLYVGPIQRYISADLAVNSVFADSVVNPVAQNTIAELNDFLTSEVTTSGLGIGIDYDTRDNIFTPTSGALYDLSYVAYRDSIGSDIEYDWYRLDGQNYFQLSSD
ncbi:MAG: outer membrane protein assembly factor BamA [Pseudomonadales bacterium]|jgi:outer membrane protein assembly factor BamA